MRGGERAGRLVDRLPDVGFGSDRRGRRSLFFDRRGRGGIRGGDDRGGFEILHLSGYCVLVAVDSFEDGAGEGVAVGRARDLPGIERMVHEPTFQQHAGNDNIPDHEKPRALDPAVVEPQVPQERGMHGGGERDVLGVPRMAGVGAEIAVAEVVLVHRRHPPRGQRISLDPRGSAHVALVEMDADKYRVRVFVRHGRAVFQGDENIGPFGVLNYLKQHL